VYKIILEKGVSKELDLLNSKILYNIAKSIDELKNEPRHSGYRKLKGSENLWRSRVGDYRIVYEINDNEKIITILRIKHRKDISKKK
jgi:mRNA interferase RelE/StbE